MAHAGTADMLRQHFEDLAAGDTEALDATMHDDFTQEWRQTGERVRGRTACLMVARNYPGGPPSITVGRVSGEGDHWVCEARMRYADGSEYHVVAVVELRDSKLCRQTDYFGPDYPAPAWRAEWVERMA